MVLGGNDGDGGQRDGVPWLGRVAQVLGRMALPLGREDRPTEIRDLGDTVLVIAQTRTQVEGSGIDIEGSVAYIFEFEGSLARRVRSYLDPRRALEAVGLLE
jgi:hypothetical protein